MIKLYVIIPDVTSGDAFNVVLNNHGIDTEYSYHKIHPRVIDNKITTSDEIVKDLNKIFKTFQDSTRSVVIACNTLQLWLGQVDPKYTKNVKVYTTFEACNWKFQDSPDKPVWLGTTPLVQATKDFPTLPKLGDRQTQDLVQELIWRLKKLYGDDISTATKSVQVDDSSKKEQEKIIQELKSKILRALRKLGVKNAVSGCTELPLIFNEREGDINFIDPAVVLAEYIKAQSVAVVFAGGTISALPDEKGTRHAGEVFDLLEKLINKKSGSLSHRNITNAGVAYGGLSEDMTYADRLNILRRVRKLVRDGVARIVVTHGTDTMEQTARYLSNKLGKLLRETGTDVVMTGANLDTTSKNSDSWDNLDYAINTNDVPVPGGVYIAFNHKVIPAKSAVKQHYVDRMMNFVDRHSVDHIESKEYYLSKVEQFNKKLVDILDPNEDKSGVLTYNANVYREDHKEFLQKVAKLKPKVVLFKLYHSGTAYTIEEKASVASLVKELTNKGIVCFGATENGEPTDLHSYKSSVALLKSGMVPLYDISFRVGLKKLKLLEINKYKKNSCQIINEMLTNHAGELDETLINKRDINYLHKIYSA